MFIAPLPTGHVIHLFWHPRHDLPLEHEIGISPSHVISFPCSDLRARRRVFALGQVTRMMESHVLAYYQSIKVEATIPISVSPYDCTICFIIRTILRMGEPQIGKKQGSRSSHEPRADCHHLVLIVHGISDLQFLNLSSLGD